MAVCSFFFFLALQPDNTQHLANVPRTLCCRHEWTACNLLLYWILWVLVPGIKLNDFCFPPNPIMVFKDLCPAKVSVCQRHWQFNEKYANLTRAWALVLVVPSGILAKVQRQRLFLKSSRVCDSISLHTSGAYLWTEILTLSQVNDNLTSEENL